MASGSGGSKFDQLRKAMSSLFTNAVPRARPLSSRATPRAPAWARAALAAEAGPRARAAVVQAALPRTTTTAPADMAAATLEAGRGLVLSQRPPTRLRRSRFGGGHLQMLAPDPVPPPMPPAPRPGISEEVPGVVARCPAPSDGHRGPDARADHFGKNSTLRAKSTTARRARPPKSRPPRSSAWPTFGWMRRRRRWSSRPR